LKLTIIEQIKSFFDRLEKKYHKKFGVFFIFIVIATFLWFLNALSKEYTTIISYPVRYTNFPQNKILVSKLPRHLDFRISSFGFTLLRYKLNTTLMPIVFDVNSFSLRSSNTDNETFYITTKLIQEDFSDQLSSDIKLIDILQDTLFFKFSQKIKKKVAVKADIKFGFQKQYMQKGNLIIEPDSIEISGPQRIIDSIEYVKTRVYEVENLNKEFRKNIQLRKIDKVKFSKKRVSVIQNVEKYTEDNIKIPVEIYNLPDSLIMKTFPNKITLTYLVGLSDYEKVSASQFKFFIDYSLIHAENNSLIEVSLDKYPQYIKLINYYPKRLEFIIEKNKNYFSEKLNIK